MIYSTIGGVCKCKGGVFNEFDTINYREVAYDCVRCRVYCRVALNTSEIVDISPKLVLVLKPIAPWIDVT